MNAIKDAVLDEVVEVDPERMGGIACFAGTRVPIESLFMHLRDNISLDAFLDDFPGVQRAHAQALLDWAMVHACKEAGALETFAR
jgi:uncharacterized protein (DUF433 family)